jgi:transmembrane sensor
VFEDRREVTLRRGRVWFDVARDPARPFFVHADRLDIRVLGTAFGIDQEADGSVVVVERGEVEVAGKVGTPIRLTAAERIALDADGAPGAPEPVDVGVASSWRRGLIVLDAASLGAVVDELIHMAPGRVLILDQSVRGLRLSGVFHADDPDAVLAAMRTSLGLKTFAIPGLATVVYR